MLFDQFDKKLKDAADNHHPAYDEKAWLKMEKLLDRHMPVEKDRRRILFLILFTFIGLGGAGLLILKPWKDKSTIAVQPQKQDPKAILNKTIEQPVKLPVEELIDGPVPQNPVSSILPIMKQAIKNSGNTKPISSNQANNDPEKENINGVAIQPESTATEQTVTKNEPVNVFPGKNQKNEDVFSLKKETPVNPDDPILQALTNEQASKKNKKKTQHALFLSVTGGPDYVFVENNGGSVKLFGGGGIGYTYNNRISLRTGFYTGRKVYTASPQYYNPPPNFYIYYPYLEKVDANCKIYEIPVSLSYHFGKSQKRPFFASAGVSSFIMKEEAYKYYYKTTPSGPTLNRNYTIKDVNQHRFAELTISGGYTKNLTRHLSITAEPYLKLPLKGVGYGKVKLTSAGMAMSVSVNPFAKRPK